MSPARSSGVGNGAKGAGCLVLLVLILIGWVMQIAGCSATKPASNALPSVPAYTAPTYAPSYSTYTYAPSTRDPDLYPVATAAPVAPVDDPTLAAESATTEDAIPLPDVPDPKETDVVPGDTAVCRDGKITHPLHHRGACSGHGGVANWI